MCKKPIQIDGLDSCLGEEGVDARFGTYLTHSKQDTRYNASLSVEGSKKIRFLFLFYIIVLLSLLILILKIRIKDTMKAYFCYRHMLL